MKILIVPASMDGYLKNSASERFRCDWLLSHLGADKYDGTQRYHVANIYDAVIFQKTYMQSWIWQLASDTKGVKILDITDPEWLFRPDPLKIMIGKMDAVTVSTEALAHDLRDIVETPVYVVPDRHELSFYKNQKVHRNTKNPALVWFGYSDNFHRVLPLLPYIQGRGLAFTAICDKPVPGAQFVEWRLETANDEIIKGDIVLNPPDLYQFKSNNKTISAHLLGMPVAETIGDIERLLNYEERVKESNIRLKEARENYNISKSADEIRAIINKHKKV